MKCYHKQISKSLIYEIRGHSQSEAFLFVTLNHQSFPHVHLWGAWAVARCTQTPNHVPATRYYAAEWWRLNCGSHLRVLAVNHQLRFLGVCMSRQCCFPRGVPTVRKTFSVGCKEKLGCLKYCSALQKSSRRFIYFSFLTFCHLTNQILW